VLAHGVCRFDVLWNESIEADNTDDPKIDRRHYFRGVRTMLMEKGHEVFHSSVGWATGVGRRASDLKANVSRILDETGADKVNILAHSMGGLDARHMLFDDRNGNRIHERIASLTTISTPHRGTAFADWGIENFSQVPGIMKKMGLDISAFEDLTTTSCRAFSENPDVKAFEAECESEIEFQTYAGRQDFWGVFNLLKPSFRIIEDKEGANDGLVSVTSAQWKEAYFKGVLERTDHLNELGWWDVSQLLERESQDELLRRMHEFYAGVAQNLP
jgi:triacylglycerol lipase